MPALLVVHKETEECIALGHHVNSVDLQGKPFFYVKGDVRPEEAEQLMNHLREHVSNDGFVVFFPEDVTIDVLEFQAVSNHGGFICPGCGGEMIWGADQDDGERTWSEYRCEDCDIDLQKNWPEANAGDVEPQMDDTEDETQA